MKKRYLILIGAVLGWALTFGIYAYGDRVLKSAMEEFSSAIKVGTASVTYKAQESDSAIVIVWTEKEALPWKDAITVVVPDKLGKKRQIIFQKQD
jgi:hypothetical protein